MCGLNVESNISLRASIITRRKSKYLFAVAIHVHNFVDVCLELCYGVDNNVFVYDSVGDFVIWNFELWKNRN